MVFQNDISYKRIRGKSRSRVIEVGCNETLSFTVVDTNDGSNHLWYNDDITKVSLDHSWFFTNFTGHGFLGLNHIINKRPTYWYVIIAPLWNSLNVRPPKGFTSSSVIHWIRTRLSWNPKFLPFWDAWGSSLLVSWYHGWNDDVVGIREVRSSFQTSCQEVDRDRHHGRCTSWRFSSFGS